MTDLPFLPIYVWLAVGSVVITATVYWLREGRHSSNREGELMALVGLYFLFAFVSAFLVPFLIFFWYLNGVSLPV